MESVNSKVFVCFFCFFSFFFYVYVCFVHRMYAWCPQRPNEGVKIPGTGVAGGCDKNF